MRTALITGGVSGIGAATATRLKSDGVRVITLDIAAGADLVVDVTDAEAVRSAVAGAGPIDILVNSAGIVGPNMPLWEARRTGGGARSARSWPPAASWSTPSRPP